MVDDRICEKWAVGGLVGNMGYLRVFRNQLFL